MSIQDKFWKKPTAPLEHVANMEAEHKPNTLSMCLFTSAKHLTRWVWDQWKPLKTTESSDLREREHILFCTKPKKQRTLWQGRDCKPSQSLHTPHSGQARSGPLCALTRIRVIWPKACSLPSFSGNRETIQPYSKLAQPCRTRTAREKQGCVTRTRFK